MQTNAHIRICPCGFLPVQSQQYVKFGQIPHLFLVFHCCIWVSFAGWVYYHRSKDRQVKNMKDARAGANCAILTKRVKLQQKQ